MNAEDDPEIDGIGVSMIAGGFIAVILFGALDAALGPLEAFYTAVLSVLSAMLVPMAPIIAVSLVLSTAYLLVHVVSKLPSIDVVLEDDDVQEESDDDDEDDLDPIEEARERYAKGEIDVLELEKELEEALEDEESEQQELEAVHEFPVGPENVVIPDDVDEEDLAIEQTANGTRVTIEVPAPEEADLEGLKENLEEGSR